MKTPSSKLFPSTACPSGASFLVTRVGATLAVFALLLSSPLRGATVLSQGPNTAIYLGLPAAQLELPQPLTGTEKVLTYKVLDWRDADYAAGPPPWYADWTVFPGVSYIDGNTSEIWMRQMGQWITTTTLVPSTVVSIHMTGDNNDGVGEVFVDGLSVAKLNMFNWPISQTVLIIVSNLNYATHSVTVADQGPMPGWTATDVHTFGAAALRSTESSPKWQQPPLSGEATNIYLGWNEGSTTDYGPPMQIAADDWVCTSTNPVTAIRWWGSYLGWPGTNPPPGAPTSFNLAMWMDQPAVGTNFSHPTVVVWQVICANFTWKFVGWDYDPRTESYEACFEYYQTLATNQWFHQDPLPTGTNIYWLSVAGVFQPTGNFWPWGWKTRPHDTNSPAPDAAVRIFQPLNPFVGGPPYQSGQPIYWPTNGNPWDLTFELISDYGGSVEKWEQPPDLSPLGIDVNASSAPQPPYLLADDFKCNLTGPITDITIWGSWWHDYMQLVNPANVTFTLSLHKDVPASATNLYSHPGQILRMWTFTPGQFNWSVYQANSYEGWMDPPAAYQPNADWTCYQYDFHVSANAFTQTNGTIYWLDVQATPGVVGTITNRFGWKTTPNLHQIDAAVWANGTEPYNPPLPWNKLTYPPGHQYAGNNIDLAFRIGTSGQQVHEVKWSQPPMHYTPPNSYNGWNEKSVYGSEQIVADDWFCNTTNPVMDIHWWGSFIGWSEMEPPAQQMPSAFHIAIWTDVPQQAGVLFSHPSNAVWQTYCTNFTWTFAGWDIDPRNPAAMPEACFKFEQDLDPPDWFQQKSGSNIYWVSIAAVYQTGLPQYPWGWKTRLRDTNSLAPDDAVRIWVPTEPILGIPYQQGQNIEYPAGTSWDAAFELTTSPQPKQYDFGDAPDTAAGPLYPTLLANNGARHVIVPGIYLGQVIDAEADGQPNATATGDNINPPIGVNDEDGVTYVGNMAPGKPYTITVVASTNGYLQTWIDFNGDGSWLTPGDRLYTDLPLSAGPSVLTFTVPNTATWGANAYARFRFSTTTNLSFTGLVADGEVEDYLMHMEPRPEHDLGDAPDSHNNAGALMTAYPKGGPAGIIATYPTVFIVNQAPYGPIHMLPKAVAFLGLGVSLEWNADVLPDEDFVNNILPATDQPDLDGLDEGVRFPLTLPHCRTTQFQYGCTVMAPLPQGGPLYVNVWFDWNRNGNWNDTLQCPDGSAAPEWAVQNQLINLPPGPYPVVLNNITPPFRSWHPQVTNTPLWMRITLSEQRWPPPNPGLVQGGEGPANGYYYGETEDYYITAYQTAGEFDFGDAPSPYPTLLANNGAQHQIVPNFHLGNLIDAEPNGLPDPVASGDDNNNLADEDGVVFVTNPLMINTQACVNVTLTGPVGGRLDAWLDFNKNGIWGDIPAERIFVNQPLVGGANPALCFPVPGTAKLGTNFARFRLSSVGALGPAGPWIDGEVEDFQVLIKQRPPATNIVITNITVTNIVTSSLTGQLATVYWAAESGIQYQLLATATLGSNGTSSIVWTNVGLEVIGPANSQSETNTTMLERFYRVVAPWTSP